MSGLRRFIVIGSSAFVLGLVAMFPARVAYSWFAPDSLQLGGISGTVWNGSATEGLAAGIYIRNLSWSFKPLSLLRASLAFSTSFDPASGFMDVDIAVSPGGSISLTNVAGAIPLDLLQRSIQPLSGLQGSVNLQLGRVVIDDGMPTTLDGTVTVSNLTATLMSSTPIGNYKAVFSSDSDGVRGVVEDTSGVLAVDGVFSLSPDRAYSFSGQVAPRPDTPSIIVQQLQLLGSADAAGKREFRIEGQL